MAKKILILTQDFDPIADRLVVELGRKGAACIRWHPDSIVSDATLNIALAGSAFAACFAWHGTSVDISEIGSVWNRRMAPFQFPARLAGNERLFAEQEIKAALSGLLQLGNWFWVNHPERNRRASSKVLQLQAAQQIGLDVPRTLVSNDPDAVRDFIARSSGEVVYKTLHSPFLPNTDFACFTSILSQQHLAQLDLIRHTGGIFQDYVEKRFEVRVTIIGQRVFATEIHSQDAPDTRVDWRMSNTNKLKHERHDLPPDVEAKCQDMMNHFGLVYGAIDFIFTPDGRYVFLENNPAGQYGWIEDLTGAPLTASLADMLIAEQAIA